MRRVAGKYHGGDVNAQPLPQNAKQNTHRHGGIESPLTKRRDDTDHQVEGPAAPNDIDEDTPHERADGKSREENGEGVAVVLVGDAEILFYARRDVRRVRKLVPPSGRERSRSDIGRIYPYMHQLSQGAGWARTCTAGSVPYQAPPDRG